MFGGIRVLLIPGWCDGRRQRVPELSAGFASWCLPKGKRDAVAVHVNEARTRFVQVLLDTLSMRNLEPARG